MQSSRCWETSGVMAAELGPSSLPIFCRFFPQHGFIILISFLLSINSPSSHISISHFTVCFHLLRSHPTKNVSGKKKTDVNRWKVFSHITHRKSPFSRQSSWLSSRDGTLIMCLIGVTTLHSHGDSQGEISVKDVLIMEMVDTQTKREKTYYNKKLQQNSFLLLKPSDSWCNVSTSTGNSADFSVQVPQAWIIIRAATSDYFQYWFISRRLCLPNNHLVCEMSARSEKVTSQLLWAACFFSPTESPKVKDNLFIPRTNKEQQQNPHIWEAGSGRCLVISAW